MLSVLDREVLMCKCFRQRGSNVISVLDREVLMRCVLDREVLMF